MSLPGSLGQIFPSYSVSTDAMNTVATYRPPADLLAKFAEANPTPAQNAPRGVYDEAVPHHLTFSTVYNWAQKYYYNYYDESLIDSQANSIAMRHDGFVQKLLWHRQLPTVSLGHTIEVDDPDDPGQIEVRKELERVVDRLPYFQWFKMQLLEAGYYGKSGAQLVWHHKKIHKKEYLTVKSHLPVNGDKIAYSYDKTPGIFIYKGSSIFDDPRARDNIQYLDKGPALFFRDDFYRDRFVIHEFQPTDTDYLFEPQKALAVHGVGFRDRFYWTWNMRAQVLDWYLNAIERVGANGMLIAYYQSGNNEHRKATVQALKDLLANNMAAFPRTMGDKAQSAIERLDPAAVGYDVMYTLLQHLEEIMISGWLGQNLSSKSAPTGLGSGVADLQGESKEDTILLDASCLAETIDDQLVSKLLKYNYFKYEGKSYRGDELPFSLRYRIQAERQNVAALIQAAQALYEMGVPMDMEDLRDRVGIPAPRSKATTLVNMGGADNDTPNAQAVASEIGKSSGKPSLFSPPDMFKAAQQKQLEAPKGQPKKEGGDKPEAFAVDTVDGYLWDRVRHAVRAIPAETLHAAHWDRERARLWVSIYLHVSKDILDRIKAHLAGMLGHDRYRVEIEREPSGHRWSPVARRPSPSTIEYFNAFGDVESFQENPCGDGGKSRGFQRGNTCAKGDFSAHHAAVAKEFGDFDMPNIKTLSGNEWRKLAGESDDLFGETGAIYGDDGTIYLRGDASKSAEGSAIHELVHAAGFNKKNVATDLNEGVTQLVAEEIGEKSGLEVHPTYSKAVRNVKDYLIPATGMSTREFIDAYRKSDDPAKMIADAVWARHGDLFTEEEGFSKTSKDSFENELRTNYGFSNPGIYLEYLVDEKGIGREDHASRDDAETFQEDPCGDGGSAHGFQQGNTCQKGGASNAGPASKTTAGTPPPLGDQSATAAAAAPAKGKGSPLNAKERKAVKAKVREEFPSQTDSYIQDLINKFDNAKTLSTKTAVSIIGSNKPEHLDDVERFLESQRKKLMAGKIRPRDVAKALTITVASQGAAEMSYEKLRSKLGDSNNFIKWLESTDEGKWFLSVTGEKTKKGATNVRAEDLIAGWFLTDEGRKALDKLDAGDYDPADWRPMAEIRRAWGDDRFSTTNVLGEKITKSASVRDVAKAVEEINAAKGDTAKITKALKKFNGIGTGKIGFIKHFLGLPGESTVDAVQVNFWLTGKGDTRKLDSSASGVELARAFKKKAGDKRISAVAARIVQARMENLSKYIKKNFGHEVSQHILHHWLWEAAKGKKVAHTGMYMGYTLSENPDAPETFSSDGHGAMIALTVPPALAKSLRLPDGEDDLHVTLAYLGKDLDPDDLDAAREVCGFLAGHYPALAGLVGGVGRFSASATSDGQDVIYAGVDVPNLADFRHVLCEMLAHVGLTQSRTHGFTPHVTLQYIDPDDDLPLSRLPNRPVTFPALSLWVGGDVEDFPFEGAARGASLEFGEEVQ